MLTSNVVVREDGGIADELENQVITDTAAPNPPVDKHNNKNNKNCDTSDQFGDDFYIEDEFTKSPKRPITATNESTEVLESSIDLENLEPEAKRVKLFVEKLDYQDKPVDNPPDNLHISTSTTSISTTTTTTSIISSSKQQEKESCVVTEVDCRKNPVKQDLENLSNTTEENQDKVITANTETATNNFTVKQTIGDPLEKTIRVSSNKTIDQNNSEKECVITQKDNNQNFETKNTETIPSSSLHSISEDTKKDLTKNQKSISNFVINETEEEIESETFENILEEVKEQTLEDLNLEADIQQKEVRTFFKLSFIIHHSFRY